MVDADQSATDLGEHVKRVPLADLRLDPENPRLPRDLPSEKRTQDRLLSEIVRRYNVIELARSIADKGFTPAAAEALLVVEEPRGSSTFVVVEGNRRLAALLLLADEERRASRRLPEEWSALAKRARQHVLDLVPVVCYESRDDLLDYLGFRHITGPAEWRPEAKGRFIARMMRGGETVGDVARRIGSNHRTVRRYAEANAVFEQGLNEDLDMSVVEAGFGVFYNALDRPNVRAFLALGPQIEIDSYPDAPVPEGELEQLAELVVLLFGDAERELDAVIVESRELKKLDEVLADSAATSELLVHRDLDRAWRTAGGGKVELVGILRDARNQLALAYAQVGDFAEDSDIQGLVAAVAELAANVAERTTPPAEDE